MKNYTFNYSAALATQDLLLKALLERKAKSQNSAPKSEHQQDLPTLELNHGHRSEPINITVNGTVSGKSVTVFARPIANPITLRGVGAPRLIGRGKLKNGSYSFDWSKPEFADYFYVYAVEMQQDRKLRRGDGVLVKA